MPLNITDIDEDPIPDSRKLRDAVHELIQKHFESDLFVSAARLDEEAEEIRLSLFHSPPIILPSIILPPESLPILNSTDNLPPRSSVDNSGME